MSEEPSRYVIARVFHLGDVLTVTTGHMFAPTFLEGVDALVEHLDACILTTRARETLFGQLPWLAHVLPPDTADLNDLSTWFCQQVVERGAYHQVLGVELVLDAEVVEPAVEVEAPVEVEVSVDAAE